MEVNNKRSAVTENYPETRSYIHLGTGIDKKRLLAKYLKLATSAMIRIAKALIKIKNENNPPKRMT